MYVDKVISVHHVERGKLTRVARSRTFLDCLGTNEESFE